MTGRPGNRCDRPRLAAPVAPPRAHRLPDLRHPALVAKAATVLDAATGGRFILGLGAGWHAGEHEAFGIPLPPIVQRFDRFERSVRAIAAILSDAPDGLGDVIREVAEPLRASFG